MKKYYYSVVETYEKRITIEAKNAEEAINKLEVEDYDETSSKLLDSVTDLIKVEDIEEEDTREER